ncbi:MAG TPA: hypothetical protein VJC07_02705 [Candidatus Nanoarchaeia archaeon]|nr:hypothetical protein [Candidatus Nanoarchaeia archaeon]
MGLFSKKKQPQPMPNFPALPQFPQEQPNQLMPSYKPEITEKPIEGISHVDDFHTDPGSNVSPKMPILPPMDMSFPKFPEEDQANPFDNPPQFEAKREDSFESSPKPMPLMIRETDKPLFIKIEDYRDSISSLELLRSKIKETEDYLEKLNDIRLAEEEELKKCKRNLDMIKQKLAIVDKKLFES